MSRTIPILLCLIIFFSCEERISPASENDINLLVECELNPSKQMTAKVAEVNSFSEVNRSSTVKDAIIRMSTGIDEEITFTYDPIKNEYFVPKYLHTVRVGQKYNLVITRESDEEQKFSTQTFIPSESNIQAKVTSYSELNPGELVGRKTIKLNCAMPTISKGEYHLLEVFIKKNNKLEKLKFEGNSEEALAFQESSVDGAIMMDVNRVNKNNFDLNFSTVNSIKPNDKVEGLHYTLSNITEASYRYRISKHKFNQSFHNSSLVPVISYTNFDKGFGFLGACVSVSDTISIVK